MSNFLAIATVSATLKDILLPAVRNDVPGANVTTERPDHAGNGDPAPRVNIYLYQVTPNAAYRNTDLPTRRPNSQIIQKPRAALDLHYLVTIYGNESTLEPQRLLGSVVRKMHERPVLTRGDIIKVITKPEYQYLVTSNLADEVELVKFTPSTISLEELSKLWSVFFQIPYTLSVAYQATVVLIESDVAPRPTLPVRERNLIVLPFHHPIIEKIVSEAGEFKPIVVDSKIEIIGKNFRSDKTKVRIFEDLVDPDPVTNTKIGLDLTVLPNRNNLRAGIQGVQVVHQKFDGPPPYGFESNVGVFVLRAKFADEDISYDPTKEEVTIKVKPKIGRSQRVILLLNELVTNSVEAPRTYSIPVASRKNDTDTLIMPIEEVEKRGQYLVRLQIDGAESPLIFENGKYVGPKLVFEPIAQFELTTNVNPAGGGEIAVDPDLPKYNKGDRVNLTAQPAQGFEFDRWSGDLGDANPTDVSIDLVMNQNRDVSANFSEVPVQQYILNILIDPAGKGRVIANPDKAKYNNGENVQITAEANSGFKFKEWSGDIGNANPNSIAITIVMSKDRDITANFESIPVPRYKLNIDYDPIDGGRVEINPDNSDYEKDESVELTAIPETNYGFKEWTGDLSGSSNPETIVMDSDKAVTANFLLVVGETIYSMQIDLEGRQVSGKIVVDAVVHVRDEQHQAVPDAEVIVLWTLPDGTTPRHHDITNASGEAHYSVENAEGSYHLRVLEIIKAGYIFDPDQGETLKETSVF